MKLKSYVVAVGMLSFISYPLYAAATTSNTQQTATIDQGPNQSSTTTSTPHQHIHSMPRHLGPHQGHHEYYEAGGSTPDYKGEMSVPPAPEACGLTDTSIIMDAMTQNVHRALPNPCNPGWFDRIFFSGGVNVDLGKWGSRGADIMGENYQRVSVNDVYLNIFATANNWVNAFASISYNTATIRDGIDIAFFRAQQFAEYSAAYDNNVYGDAHHSLQLEQGFATIANFDVAPFFIQVGKQFQDFSRYTIHPITRSLTQVMSETLATSFKAGFIVNGFSGSLYVFDDPVHREGRHHYSTNYGAALGYERPCDVFGWSVGAAYLYNLIGVNDIAYNVNIFHALRVLDEDFENGRLGYEDSVPGVAAYLDINSGPFTVSLRYTTALNHFNREDLPRNGIIDINNPDAKGARPWTAGIQAEYGFEGYCGMPQNIFIGYQTSRQAAGLQIPKHRYLAGLGIEPMHNTSFSLEWDHDSGYKQKNGGTGKTSNLVTVRTSVFFG